MATVLQLKALSHYTIGHTSRVKSISIYFNLYSSKQVSLHLSGPRSFQDKYHTKTSPPRQKQNKTRAEHLNYYCSCSSELLLGAKPAALQVPASAPLRK